MELRQSKKAESLWEIKQATRFNEAVGPEHPFFTDFSQLRSGFEENVVYKALNVNASGSQYTFDSAQNSQSKVLFYFGGAPGSGKTSELKKYIKFLDHKDCFYCIHCRIDIELSLNNVEFMDILIFQLEQLLGRLQRDHVSGVSDRVLKRMEQWFQEREHELKRVLALSAEMEIGSKVEATGIFSKLIALFGSFKAGIKGSHEWVVATRMTFKNRFSDFAHIFNEFVEEVNVAIRKQGYGQEILFIIDGLEKSFDKETRRKIIIDEEDRIRSIKAYTIFTLPPELMKWRQKLIQYSIFRSFPFVKLYYQENGERVEEAFARFREFVDKRISKELFESAELIDQFIHFSGGSPRELLRLLEGAFPYADDSKGKYDQKCLDMVVKYFAAQVGNYLTKAQLAKLQEIKTNNDHQENTDFDEVLEDLLEQVIVMEYNDGSFKKVSPIVEASNIYQQRVK